MLAEPASIYFMTQLRFLPIEDAELRFGKTFVHSLFNELSKPGGHFYENLALQSNPPRMTTTRATSKGESASTCQVAADAILIEETESEINIDGFVEIVETVLKAAHKVKQETPPIFGQRCVFRCLVKPASENSITLLAGKVSHVLRKIQPFERPPQFFGIRFRFPPFKVEHHIGEDDAIAAVDEKLDFVTVRFETWSKDVHQVWIEVGAMYFFPDSITLSDLDRVTRNIKEAHEFLTEKCINFLNQFDDLSDPEDEEDETDEGEGG
jgi:hypothetical protein